MKTALVVQARLTHYLAATFIALLCAAELPARAQTAGPAIGGTVGVNFNISPNEPNVAGLTAIYQDSAGAGDIQKADLYVTPLVPGQAGSAGKACVMEWRNTGGMGSLYLVNDAGNAFSSYGIPVGAGGAAGGEQVRVNNSQCSVRSEKSSMAFVSCPQAQDGSSCLSITFEINFGGSPLAGKSYSMYMVAQDGQGRWSTDFTTPFGSIAIPASRLEPCYAINIGYDCSVSANPQNSLSTTFTADFFDANGVAEFSDVVLHILNVAPGSVAGWSAHGCIIQYVPSSNTYQVVVDAGGSFSGHSNSQCNVTSISVEQNSGTNLVLAITVQFSTAYAGTHNLYMEADRVFNNVFGFNLSFQNLASTYSVP